jgi:hypothetical protein
MSEHTPTDDVPAPEPGADDAWRWTAEPKDPDQAGPPAEFVDVPQVPDDEQDAPTASGPSR